MVEVMNKDYFTQKINGKAYDKENLRNKILTKLQKLKVLPIILRSEVIINNAFPKNNKIIKV